MSSDLNQAAERLRVRIEANWVYDKRTKEYERICDDAFTVVRAYLAEHAADDDEPITEEWLTSQGYSLSSKDGPYDYLLKESTNGSRAIIRMCQSVFISNYWCKVTTRGQLRLLLRALQ